MPDIHLHWCVCVFMVDLVIISYRNWSEENLVMISPSHPPYWFRAVSRSQEWNLWTTWGMNHTWPLYRISSEIQMNQLFWADHRLCDKLNKSTVIWRLWAGEAHHLGVLPFTSSGKINNCEPQNKRTITWNSCCYISDRLPPIVSELIFCKHTVMCRRIFWRHWNFAKSFVGGGVKTRVVGTSQAPCTRKMMKHRRMTHEPPPPPC